MSIFSVIKFVIWLVYTICHNKISELETDSVPWLIIPKKGKCMFYVKGALHKLFDVEDLRCLK